MGFESECVKCLLSKHLDKFTGTIDEKTNLEYMRRLLDIIGNTPDHISACVTLEKIHIMQKELLGYEDDYTDIKTHFNSLVLKKVPEIERKIENADDPLYTAMCYAMMGNYIDFGVLDSVEEQKLESSLEKASELNPDMKEYELFVKDLSCAKRLLLITDNCGEIVLDKLFLTRIAKTYPELEIKVMVRGKPVFNDATIEDARQVGIDKMFEIIPNGSGIVGTVESDISEKAKKVLCEADVVIAKGQANFETLCHCNKNIYYLFLCKCKMFSDRFGVPQFTGMLINDLRLR